GRVLAIHDDEVELVVRDQARKPVVNGGAARAAHHVAKKKQSHDLSYARAEKTRKPSSVRIASSGTSCGSAGTASTSWQAKATPISRGVIPLARSRAIARS